MLPPDDYGEYEGGYPEEFDQHTLDLWASEGLDPNEAYGAVAEYFHNQGFSNEEWFNYIQEVENVYKDEQGNLHFTFFWDNGEYADSEEHHYYGGGSI